VKNYGVLSFYQGLLSKFTRSFMFHPLLAEIIFFMKTFLILAMNLSNKHVMKNLFFLFLITFALSSCSQFSQFSEPLENLFSSWEETTETVNALTEKATVEQTNLTQLMDRVPQKTTSVFKFGENYLEQSDQLTSKFMGHKSTFDELVENIQQFSEEWQEKGKLVTVLEQQLSDGQLPGNVLTQIDELNIFMGEGNKKTTKWQSELNEVIEQCQKTGDAIIQLTE